MPVTSIQQFLTFAIFALYIYIVGVYVCVRVCVYTYICFCFAKSFESSAITARPLEIPQHASFKPR